MKTIFILLITALVGVSTGAQAQQAAAKPATSDKGNSVMVYSEEEEALIYKQTGKEILIETLPEYGKEAIPIIVNQDVKGNFTFKKHPALLLPEYYNVVIEDTLTGEHFDLKNADSYSFVVAKDVPERFMLQMSKTKTSL